ncbi:uncharacterized protein LOC111627294 [Centruroides sculpturatus]|uniref:uncharacterized protein LOC111616915 n=1 Tax=Centruroides sculpturatus TaxID=218467 RepID=UPI000C6CB980|nr:uncharacterized protein LOC111616915 [Centruroides sculpturatus]XP_023226632.1 uncharacterized protein LOC111627294 [Centruroides sculpturatus]
MSKPRLVTGITATGKITLGNYIGAIKQLVALQDRYDLFIFVADLHALTIEIDPETLSLNRQQTAALYLSCGLDPEKVTLFYQSDVPAHSQLAWIMQNIVTVGELSRMTQFKDKGQKQANQTTQIRGGLLTYPTLMAADILLYNPKLVPVGSDQLQHLELTAHLAQRFNNKYGPTFQVPEPLLPAVGAKIMSLSDPTKKMSKSDPNPKSLIALLDDPELAAQKILRSKTDSENKVYLDDKKPGIKNLLTIYAALTNQSLKTVSQIFAGENSYLPLKQALAHEVKQCLTLIQNRYQHYLDQVDQIVQKGARRANQVADKQYQLVAQKIGLN